MHKSDLASCVAHHVGVNRSPAGDSMDAILEAVGEALSRRERVQVVAFGTFGTMCRAARTGRSPGLGVSMEVPALTAPVLIQARQTVEGRCERRDPS